MNKVLITCPPMLGAMAKLRDEFVVNGLEPIVVAMEQTLAAEELKELLPNVDGWILGDDPASEEVLAAGKQGRLRAVVKWGIGVDNVDFQAAKKFRIPIRNTPGMFNDEVADLALGYMIALARQTHFIDREVRAGNWPKPSGISLRGKTLALIGMGNIGSAVAERALVCGMNVIGYDPAINVAPKGVVLKSWPNSLGDADFLIITASLNETTKRMINKQTIKLMKKGVRIVNVSRGGLIKQADLVNALQSGYIHSVAMDVFEDEPPSDAEGLFAHPLSIFGSHNGSNTDDAVLLTSVKSIKLLRSLLDEGCI